ncbi:MAG: glycosyltransferase HpnI [Verrucomicrobiota bacterium]|jgi:ceramide glucosyltransferase
MCRKRCGVLIWIEVNVAWMNWAGGGLSLLGLIAVVWQWVVARRFPLGRRVGVAGRMPGVTVIKPVEGADEGVVEALGTWLRLEYPGEVELLLVVGEGDEPGRRVVERLAGESAGGGMNVRVVEVRGAVGCNGKMAKVVDAARGARHDFLVVSDADVAVTSDLLGELMLKLGHEQVGMACCFYSIGGVRRGAMALEVLAVNVDFWSQVLQARSLGGLDFGLGAVMGFRREWLEKAGGFGAVVDYLADDFQLGNRVHGVGGVVELCAVPVVCMDPDRGWREVWRHQVRWGRTIRVSRPWPYMASILSHALLGPSIWVVISGVGWTVGAVGAWKALGWATLVWVAMAGLRVVMAADLQRRFVAQPAWRVASWKIILKDLLGMAVWVVSFTGNRVEWRGRVYRVGRDGKLLVAGEGRE